MVSLQTQVAIRSLDFAQRAAQAHAVGAMNSVVRITRGGGWNPLTYEYDPDADEVIYQGPGGVTLQTGSVQSDYADEPTYTSSATIYIPQSAPRTPRIDDLAEILSCPDPETVGAVFRIIDVVLGGRISASIQLSGTVTPASKEVTT
jgi:hypothetical protein